MNFLPARGKIEKVEADLKNASRIYIPIKLERIALDDNVNYELAIFCKTGGRTEYVVKADI